MTASPVHQVHEELPLVEGAVAWAELEPVRGREQGGRRPVLVVASPGYLDAVTSLVIVLPVTSRDRGWANHVLLGESSGLPGPSWAMTEQPRTISRDRLGRVVGFARSGVLDEVRLYLRDYLGL